MDNPAEYPACWISGPSLLPRGRTTDFSWTKSCGRGSQSLGAIGHFLLLARYVPNVAKRSIRDQCKKYILRNDRPTDLSFGPYWRNFKWPYLREGSSDPLHIWFYGGVFGVG